MFKKIKKKFNLINLIENVKIMNSNDLMFIRNIVVNELRKRGVKHV